MEVLQGPSRDKLEDDTLREPAEEDGIDTTSGCGASGRHYGFGKRG
jgi:hypothetical protein